MIRLLRALTLRPLLEGMRSLRQDVAQRRALRAARKALREVAKRYEREGLPHCRICGGLLHDERDH